MSMSFYEHHILPYLLDWAMRHGPFLEYRDRLVPTADGRVLEIGIGSGHNLPFYSRRASAIIGLDPSPALLLLAARARAPERAVTLLRGTAEAIPLDDASIDTVVTTWTLCSIPDATAALAEARRVLRPAGRLIFVEHGRAPDPFIQRWQDRLTPLWKQIAGGCHINRPIDRMLEAAGFHIEQLSTGYARGPRLMTFMYEGWARLR